MPSEPSEIVAASPPVPGSGANPGARALYAVATAFATGTDPDRVLFALVHRSAAAAGAGRGWLLTEAADGGSRVAAAWPDSGQAPPATDQATVLTLPLFHAGSPVATLVLGSPAAGSFGPADRRLAAALAHPAAAVAATALRLADAEARARGAQDTTALQAEIVAAVDHDLRTPLTTILGALQTLARPEYAPTDPDLAALLASALNQAQRLRSLLGDLLLVSCPAPRRESLLPETLRALIAEAARSGMGAEATVPIEVPADLPPVTVDPPALRRVLDGVLRRACRRHLAPGVAVAARGDDAVLAIVTDGTGPLVPDLSTRLAAAMGATLEETTGAEGHAVVRLVLPGALRPADAGT